MVDLESDAFPFIAESNAAFSTSNGLGGISDNFDSTGPFGINLNRLTPVESSRKMTPTSTSSLVLTTNNAAAAVAADPVMPSTSRSSSSNFLDELCGSGTTSQQQQSRSAQENEYLKELTELLQDTLSRPDSSLRNVDKSMLMDLVKRLTQQSKDKPENAVQHEDVSSSGSILLASHIGPMILEYLDGFFFVMNTDGFVEFVSQNVSKYLKFDQSEMVNKPIYNFVAAENHDLFSGLLPENMAWNLLGFGNNFDVVVGDNSPKLKHNGSADSPSLKTQQQRRSHRFMCQFLTNAAAECSSADILPTYQNLQVTAICLPLPSGCGDEDDFHLSFNVMTESQPCLVCVARRLPDRSGTNFEGCQFSVRCNKNGLILDVNSKEKATSHLLPKDISSSAMQIQQLFHVQDASFFDKVLQNDCSIKLPSILKLFQSATNNYVPVQVKCSKIGPKFSATADTLCQASASGLFLPPSTPDSFHNVPFVQFDFLVLRSDDNQSQPSSTNSNSSEANFADFFVYDSKNCDNGLKNPLDKQRQSQKNFPETSSLNSRSANGNNANSFIDQSSSSSSSSALHPPPFDDSTTFFLNNDFHYYGRSEKAVSNTMESLIGDDFGQCFEIGSDPSSLDVKPQLKLPLAVKSPATLASAAFSTPATPLDFNATAAAGGVVAAAAATQQQQHQQTSSFNQRSLSAMSEPIVEASSFFQASQIASQTEVQENDLQRFCQMMNLPPAQNSPFIASQLDQTEPGEQILQEGHTILKELLSQEEKQQQQQQQQNNPNVNFCEQPFHSSPMLQNFAMQQQYFAPLQSDIISGPPPPAPIPVQGPLQSPTNHTPNGKRKNKTTTARKNAATTKKSSKKAANNNNVGWIPNPTFGSNAQSSTNNFNNFVQNQAVKNTANCMPSPLQQQQQQTHILQQLLQEDETCNNVALEATQLNAKMTLGKRKASANAQGQPITPPAFFVSPAAQFAVQNQQVKSESLLIQLLERPLASHANQTRSLPTSIANTQFDKIAKENQENPNKQPIISTLIVESLLNNNKNAKQQQQQTFNQNSTFSPGFYQPKPSLCQNPNLASSPFIGQNVPQISSPNNNLYSQMLDANVRPPSDNFTGQNRHFQVNNSPPMQNNNSQESFMEILSQGTSRNGLQTTPNTLHSPSPQQMMPPLHQNQRTFPPNNCPMSNASHAGNIIEIYDISPPNSYGQPNKLNPPNLPQNVRQRNTNNNQGNPPQPKKPRQRNTNSTKKLSKKQQQQLQQQQQQAALNQQYLSSSTINNFPVATFQIGNVANQQQQQQFYFDRNEPAVTTTAATGFAFPVSISQERFSKGPNRFTTNNMQQQNIGVNDNLPNCNSSPPNNGPFSPMRNGPPTFQQQNAACMTRPPIVPPDYASTSHQNSFKNIDPVSQQQRFVAHQQAQILPNGAFVCSQQQQQPQVTFQNRQRIWSDSDNQFLNRHLQQSNQSLSHVATLPSLTNQDLSSFDQHEPLAADLNKNRQRRPRAASSSEIAPLFNNNNNAASLAIPRQQNSNATEQQQQIFAGQRQTAGGAVHQNANEWWTMNVDLDGEPDMDDEVTQNLLKMLNES